MTQREAPAPHDHSMAADFQQRYAAAIEEAQSTQAVRRVNLRRVVEDYDAPQNPWDQREALLRESARQTRDRERDRAVNLADRDSMPLEEACIHPTAAEVGVSASVAYKRTIIEGAEYQCVLALAREYANNDDVAIEAKRKSARGADIYAFKGRCPFCHEAHNNNWVAINQPSYPDTTLIQCLKTKARRVVQHWPF